MTTFRKLLSYNGGFRVVLSSQTQIIYKQRFHTHKFQEGLL